MRERSGFVTGGGTLEVKSFGTGHYGAGVVADLSSRWCLTPRAFRLILTRRESRRGNGQEPPAAAFATEGLLLAALAAVP
jgi:hypothetical protein